MSAFAPKADVSSVLFEAILSRSVRIGYFLEPVY